MIEGFKKIPDEIKENNEIFFNNGHFHGDFKYIWDKKNEILEIYQKRGDILNMFMIQDIGEKLENKKLADKLINEEIKKGKIHKIKYQVNENNKLEKMNEE